MLSRRVGLFAVYLVLMFDGLEACFNTSEYYSMSLNTGISVYKECQCTEPGYSTDDLRWLYNGLTLGPGTENSAFTEVQSDTQSLNLHIPTITKTMSGTYSCETKLNGKIFTQSYTITAYDPIDFYDTPIDQNLVYGQDSEIKCKVLSDIPVSITWQKENGSVVYEISGDENDDKYTMEEDSLIIHNVTFDDAGQYKCTARVALTNEAVDKYIQVKVMTVPRITAIKATPEIYPIAVVAGINLTIECIADGTPHPEYHWNKTSEQIGEELQNKTYHPEINAIIFENIQPEDMGIYTCHAYNLAGIATKDTFVEVLVPPYIMDFPNITGIEGSEVQLVCNATGKPSPSISISYEGREGDFNVTDTGTMPNMEIIMLDRSKEGIYICEATNDVGRTGVAMYLTVLHRPYFDVHEENIWGWEGKIVSLNCEHDSNPAADISWRFQGDNNIQTQKEVEINRQMLEALNRMPEPYFSFTIDNETAYGVYECTAKNMYGEATKRINLTEGFTPGYIEHVAFKNISATSITFDIVGPDHVSGPHVLGFTVTYDEEKNFNITDIHINRTWALGRPFRLDNLKPSTKYYIRFAAVNEVGTGIWSQYFEFYTLEKSVPESPIWNEDPIILARNSHVLKWRAPDDNGEEIDSYILTYCLEEDQATCKTKRILPATEVELVDLEFNTTYYLELIAHNAKGASVPANITVFVPAPQLSFPTTLLPSGAIIGISIVIVVLCLLLLDVLLLVWRRQGIIATCCFKKEKKRKESTLNSRDKKGLLTNGESEDRPGSINNGHKEFQYNKNTGVITGKHSAV